MLKVLFLHGKNMVEFYLLSLFIPYIFYNQHEYVFMMKHNEEISVCAHTCTYAENKLHQRDFKPQEFY